MSGRYGTIGSAPSLGRGYRTPDPSPPRGAKKRAYSATFRGRSRTLSDAASLHRTSSVIINSGAMYNSSMSEMDGTGSEYNTVNGNEGHIVSGELVTPDWPLKPNTDYGQPYPGMGAPEEAKKRWVMPHWSVPLGLLIFVTIMLAGDIGRDYDPKTEVTGVLATASVMLLWWITEPFNMAVTSLLPLVLFPLQGIISGKNVSAYYFSDTIVIFFGSCLIGRAVELYGIHHRIAEAVLSWAGGNPKHVLGAFIAVTAFLSMWLSNTATAAMMMPMAAGIAQSLAEEEEQEWQDNQPSVSVKSASDAQNMGWTDPAKAAGGASRSSGNGGGTATPGAAKSSQHHASFAADGALSAAAAANATAVTSAPPSKAHKPSEGGVGLSPHEESPQLRDLKKAMALGVAYASSIGGMATLTGTGANLAMRGVLEAAFPGAEAVNWTQFFFMVAPLSWVLNIALWALLCHRYMGGIFGPSYDIAAVSGASHHSVNSHQSSSMHHREPVPSAAKPAFGSVASAAAASTTGNGKTLAKMESATDSTTAATAGGGVAHTVDGDDPGRGPMSREEVIICVDAAAMALLWFFRAPPKIPGWATLFPLAGYPTDGTVAIACALVLFLTPVAPPAGEDQHGKKPSNILRWDVVSTIPWSIVFLLGGGTALSGGFQSSGLMPWLVGDVQLLEHSTSNFWFMAAMCFLALFIGNFLSNLATAAVLLVPLPCIAVKGMGMNPLLLVIPVALCCGLSFLLPIGTPPNAIAMATGWVSTRDMVVTGLLLSAIALFTVIMAGWWWMPLVVGGGSMPPPWAIVDCAKRH